MNCEIWTIISALGTIGTFIVAGLVFYFERLRIRNEKPKITIWVNHQGYDGEITLFNSGRESLPIKTLDIENHGPIIHSLFLGGASIPGGTQSRVSNLVLEPNKIVLVLMRCEGGTPGQFKLRFHLFDGSFKFVQIDLSYLGPYSL